MPPNEKVMNCRTTELVKTANISSFEQHLQARRQQQPAEKA